MAMEYHGISSHAIPSEKAKSWDAFLRLRVQVQQIPTKLKPYVAIRAYQSRLVSLYRTQYRGGLHWSQSVFLDAFGILTVRTHPRRCQKFTGIKIGEHAQCQQT